MNADLKERVVEIHIEQAGQWELTVKDARANVLYHSLRATLELALTDLNLWMQNDEPEF